MYNRLVSLHPLCVYQVAYCPSKMRTQNGVVPAACLQVYEWRVQLKVSSHKKLSLDACTVTDTDYTTLMFCFQYMY